MADNKIDQEKVKEGIKIALKCVASIAQAAGAVHPIFNVAGSLLKMVLDHEDDEDLMKKLKGEFEKINQKLDDISQQNKQTLLDIQKTAVENQYAEIERNLRDEFRSYMEIVKAEPEHLQHKKDDFVESYDDQHMNNLYEGVVKKPKAFSRPILDVYWEHSKGDKQVMKNLCNHLAHLFVIGLGPMMSYYAFKEDDMESRKKEWEENMEKVRGVMGEWM